METKYSGFGQNHSYLDGRGWVPHPILDGNTVVNFSWPRQERVSG